ncbi:MAG: GDYXXLXY domain-containing protein [Endomicrobia bacterium]|nr:GDYXXLXY domain-containing protein [Endomicrobiia bacterium]
MNRKKYFLLLLSAWFLMIGSYTVYKESLLRYGKEVMLRVIPVDPRDLFRGDYVILSYEISSISGEQKIFGSYGEDAEEEKIYYGETVYVALIEDGEYYKGGNIYKSRPKRGLFIKGKIRDGAIVYGIENFFVPEGEGKIIEDARNRNKVSAKVFINSYGSALVKELYIDGKKAVFKNKNEENY